MGDISALSSHAAYLLHHRLLWAVANSQNTTKEKNTAASLVVGSLTQRVAHSLPTRTVHL